MTMERLKTLSNESEKPAAASVSIFYPCYHNWGTMGSMVLLTVQTAERLGLDNDLTIVDDGSAPTGSHSSSISPASRVSFGNSAGSGFGT